MGRVASGSDWSRRRVSCSSAGVSSSVGSGVGCVMPQSVTLVPGRRLSSFGHFPANCRGYSRSVAGTNGWAPTDEQREVSFEDFADELVVLPDHTTDDTDSGWGER